MKKPKLPSVGIVGGAGPLAGALLFQKIVQLCQKKYGCKNDADFPEITLLSYPFLDMLRGVGVKERKAVQKQLQECFAKLEKSGAEIVTIACNTLHEFLPKVRASTFSFVHMIEETAVGLQKSKMQKAVVLATTTSAECRLHEKYFECIYPDDRLQDSLQKLIEKILAGKQGKEDAKRIARLVNTQFAKGKDEKIALVLGCTELSLFNEQFSLAESGLDGCFTIFDPNQVVAEQICKRIFNNQ